MEKDWKLVFLTGQLYKAEIAKEIMENNGINAVIINQQDSAFLDIGNVEVYVNENDVDQANELLKELKN